MGGAGFAAVKQTSDGAFASFRRRVVPIWRRVLIRTWLNCRGCQSLVDIVVHPDRLVLTGAPVLENLPARTKSPLLRLFSVPLVPLVVRGHVIELTRQRLSTPKPFAPLSPAVSSAPVFSPALPPSRAEHRGASHRELPDVTGFLVVLVVTLGLFVVPVGATLMQGPAIVASLFGR